MKKDIKKLTQFLVVTGVERKQNGFVYNAISSPVLSTTSNIAFAFFTSRIGFHSNSDPARRSLSHWIT